MEKSIENSKSPRTIEYYYARLQHLKEQLKQQRQTQYEKLKSQAMQLQQHEKKLQKQALSRTKKVHAEPKPIMSTSYAFGSSTPRNTMISETTTIKHRDYRRSSISIVETVKQSNEFDGKVPKKRASSVGEKPTNCALSPKLFTRNNVLRLSTSRLPVMISSASKKPKSSTENTPSSKQSMQTKATQPVDMTPLSSKLPRKSSVFNGNCTPKISNDRSKSTIERRLSFNYPPTTKYSSEPQKTDVERRRQSMAFAPSAINSKCVITAPIKSGVAVDKTKIIRSTKNEDGRPILSECQNTTPQRANVERKTGGSLIQRHIDNLKYQATEKYFSDGLSHDVKQLAKEHEEIIKRLAESMAKTKLRREAELEKENQKRLERIENERRAKADKAEKLRSETAERQMREAQEREERRKRVQMIMTRIRSATDAAESTTIPTNQHMTSISMFGSVIY